MNRPNAKVILLCLGLFFLFVILRFPYQNLRGWVFTKVYKTTGILINAEELYPVFLGWPGASLHNVDLTLPLAGSDVNLSAEKVVTRVGIGGLFPPRLSFSMKVKGLKKGGYLYLKFSQGKNDMWATIDAEDINLEQLRSVSFPGTFEGLLNADGDLDLQLSDLAKSSGTIIVKIAKLKIPTFTIPMSSSYSFAIPSMVVNDLSARITIKNGVAEFNEFKFGSPETDMAGSLAGEIRLGQTWDNSAVNLTLRLQLAQKYKVNPQAATFVSFLNPFKSEKTGGYGMRCTATMVEITTQFRCAIPEKVVD